MKSKNVACTERGKGYSTCNGWMLVDRNGKYADEFFFYRREAVLERDATFLHDAKWEIVPVRVVPR